MLSRLVPVLRATARRSLGVLAAAVLVAGCAASPQQSQAPSDTAAATPSASVAPTSPEAAASPSEPAVGRPSIGTGIGATWTTVATMPGAGVSDVTAGGEGWVAVGFEGPAACDVCPGLDAYTAMIWSSADGRSWHEVAVPGLDASLLRLVASGAGGLVAIGARQEGDAGVTKVLVSSDGVTWTWVAVRAFAASGTWISDVIGNGSTFVAVGYVSAPDEAGSRAAIWSSTNGRDWQEAFRSAEEGSVRQLAVGGTGWVAVGDVHGMPAVWVSDDAVAWTRRDLPFGSGATGGTAQAVLSTGSGVVAVGYAEYPQADGDDNEALGFAAWRLSDGVTWQPAPVTADFLENIGGGHLVYATDVRVFALGSGCLCGNAFQPASRWWSSPDGLAWTEHAEPAPGLTAVIPHGDGLLGVGWSEFGGVILISE